MALFRDQTIELVDLVRRRSLGRYEGLPHDNRSAFFVDEDHLRIYLGDTGRSRPVEGIEIFGLDIEKRNLERLGNLPELLAHRQLVASPDGQRLLIRGPAGTPQLRDGRTGALLADLNAAATSKDGSSRYDLLASFWGFFLADGRAIIHSPSPKAEILEVFSVDGELLRRFELAPASTLVFQTEWAPGRVLIRFRAPGAKTGNWSLTEVNVATGKVRPLGDDHRSKSEPWVAYTPRAWFPPANEERASGFFLLRDQGRVSWLNPDTGQNIVFWEGNSKK